MVNKTAILKYAGGALSQTDDLVIREHQANIFVNEELYISLLCLPEHFEELAVGFLFSEGVIASYSDIQKIGCTSNGSVFITLNGKVDTAQKNKRVLVSGCAKGSVNLAFLADQNLPVAHSQIQVDPKDLTKLMAQFGKSSSLYQKTGCVHSCALILPGGGRLFYEDIGRHNALDKIVGTALIQGAPIQDGVLLTSGRISSEILIKTAKLGIPVLASHAAPTDLSVELARKVNMTLIGFVRGERFNVYAGAFRVTTE